MITSRHPTVPGNSYVHLYLQLSQINRPKTSTKLSQIVNEENLVKIHCLTWEKYTEKDNQTLEGESS